MYPHYLPLNLVLVSGIIAAFICIFAEVCMLDMLAIISFGVLLVLSLITDPDLSIVIGVAIWFELRALKGKIIGNIILLIIYEGKLIAGYVIQDIEYKPELIFPILFFVFIPTLIGYSRYRLLRAKTYDRAINRFLNGVTISELQQLVRAEIVPDLTLLAREAQKGSNDLAVELSAQTNANIGSLMALAKRMQDNLLGDVTDVETIFSQQELSLQNLGFRTRTQADKGIRLDDSALHILCLILDLFLVSCIDYATKNSIELELKAGKDDASTCLTASYKLKKNAAGIKPEVIAMAESVTKIYQGNIRVEIKNDRQVIALTLPSVMDRCYE